MRRGNARGLTARGVRAMGEGGGQLGEELADHPHERRPLQAFALHLHAPQRVRLSAPQRGLTEPQPAAGRLSGDLSPEVGSSVFALLPQASVLVTPAWGRLREPTPRDLFLGLHHIFPAQTGPTPRAMLSSSVRSAAQRQQTPYSLPNSCACSSVILSAGVSRWIAPAAYSKDHSPSCSVSFLAYRRPDPCLAIWTL